MKIPDPAVRNVRNVRNVRPSGEEMSVLDVRQMAMALAEADRYHDGDAHLAPAESRGVFEERRSVPSVRVLRHRLFRAGCFCFSFLFSFCIDMI